MPNFKVIIGEDDISDFIISGQVQLTMLEAFNSFEFEYFNRFYLVEPGETVSIALHGDTILDGYVDVVEISDSADGIRYTFRGRSKTADLVDCYSNPKVKWSGPATMQAIATAICEPFGITARVISDIGTEEQTAIIEKPFPHFAIQKGETAIDTLARAATKKSLFIYCVGGDLVLAPKNYELGVELKRGERPLISSTYTYDYSQRFSVYVFKGQSRPTENNFGSNASQLKSNVQDAVLTALGRYRPLQVVAEAHDNVDLAQRAQFEHDNRVAESLKAQVQVEGWRIPSRVQGITASIFNPSGSRSEEGSGFLDVIESGAGKPWRPNTVVTLTSPFYDRSESAGINLLTYTVTNVVFSFEAGQPEVTDLTCAYFAQQGNSVTI